MQIRTPKHIQEEIDCLFDELMLNQESFDEFNPEQKATLTKTTYRVRKEVALFRLTEYYIEEIQHFQYYGVKATSRADRYFIEQHSKNKFTTHEL